MSWIFSHSNIYSEKTNDSVKLFQKPISQIQIKLKIAPLYKPYHF